MQDRVLSNNLIVFRNSSSSLRFFKEVNDNKAYYTGILQEPVSAEDNVVCLICPINIFWTIVQEVIIAKGYYRDVISIQVQKQFKQSKI